MIRVLSLSTTVFSSGTAESLCLVLLHTLWQGAFLAAMLSLALMLIPRSRPQVRYVVALCCLSSLIPAALLTSSILKLPSAISPATSTGVSNQEVPTSSLNRPTINDGQDRTIASPQLAVNASTIPSTDRSSAGHLWWTSLESGVSTASPFLLGVWGLGVVVCLLRCVMNRSAARGWKYGEAVTDSTVLDRFHELKNQLRIRRPVRLLASIHAIGPCVVGTIQPAILIPAAMISGLTPGQWTAILAHELAHIRRWDDLVNFGQQILESFLFFNPAVWWMSRQVRIEREACCDAWGARLTESPHVYATVLIDVAERMLAIRQPALAFADEQSGTLMDRIRRLVSPQRTTGSRVGWLASLALIVTAVLLVTLLQRGSDLAVFATAQFLTDDERVMELVKTADEISPSLVESANTGRKLTIEGRITTDDGSPLPEHIWITSFTKLGQGGTGASQDTVPGRETNQFRATVSPGISWLSFGTKDYATAIVGPFQSGEADKVENVSVTLKRGVAIPVKVVDESGAPVGNATLSWIPVVDGVRTAILNPITSDLDGHASIPHIDIANRYDITVKAKGFQTRDRRDLAMSPTETLTLQISHAKPASGTVLDVDGRPIGQAAIKKLRLRRPGLTDSTGSMDPPLAHTDQDGRFVLSELQDGIFYDLIVQHPGFGPGLLRDVQAGSQDLLVKLPRPITVKGIVRGTANEWESVGKAYNSWALELGNPDYNGEFQLRNGLNLKPENGEAQFEIPELTTGLLTLSFEGRQSKHSITDDHHELVIDLGTVLQTFSQPQQDVRILFTHEGKRVYPAGEITIHAVSPQPHPSQTIPKPILNGQADFEVPVPCDLGISSSKLIGFALQQSDFKTSIRAGEDPAIVEIPVVPAGAVKGIVVDAEGKPVANADVSLNSVLTTGVLRSRRVQTEQFFQSTNSAGEFFIGPLPFGAQCDLKVSRDKYVMPGPQFTISEQNVLPDFRLSLGKPVAATIRVLDPKGQPLRAVRIDITCRHPRSMNSWLPSPSTDSHGELVIDAINPEIASEMFALAACQKNYVPAEGRLRSDGGVTEIRLEPGLVIEGTLLDKDGRPTVGQMITAKPVQNPVRDGRYMEFLAEAPTDAQGRFRFSNLPAEPMTLHPEIFISGGPSPSFQPTTPNQAKPVTLKSH